MDPSAPLRPSAGQQIRRRILLLLALLLTLFLLYRWQGLADDWRAHGCTHHPYLLALEHGAPTWDVYCPNG